MTPEAGVRWVKWRLWYWKHKRLLKREEKTWRKLNG